MEDGALRAQPAALPPQEQSAEPRWLITLRRSWLGLVIGLLVVLSGEIKTVAEGWNELLVTMHLKRDALDIAQDTARGQFSDSLARTAGKRLFWIHRYLSSINFKMTEADSTEIWKGYMAAVEEWNDNLLVNIVGLKNYYSDEKRSAFESGIVPLFNSIHSCALKIRYPGVYSQDSEKLCTFPQSDPVPASTEAISRKADELNEQLYCFVTGLDIRGQDCTVLIFDWGKGDDWDAPSPKAQEKH